MKVARTITRLKDGSEVDLERHSRCCKVCNHEAFEDIKDAYMNWEPIIGIIRKYDFNEGNFYRHVRAVGWDMKKLSDRKRFYLKIMEASNLEDVSASEAVAAGKLIEQIEGRIENPKLSPEDRSKFYEEIMEKIEKKKEAVESEDRKEPT